MDVTEQTVSEMQKNAANATLLEAFISAKRIEGCSEKSLKYYSSTIRHLFNGLNKSIREIETNDLWFGDYNYYISDTTVAVSLFVEYTLSVSANRCVFSGNGHMTCFEIECRIKDETDNSLTFDFVKSLSARHLAETTG